MGRSSPVSAVLAIDLGLLVSYDDGVVERHCKEKVYSHCVIPKAKITGLASHGEKWYAVDNQGKVYDITTSSKAEVLV